MPKVAATQPTDEAALLFDAHFTWRGQPLAISVWTLP